MEDSAGSVDEVIEIINVSDGFETDGVIKVDDSSNGLQDQLCLMANPGDHSSEDKSKINFLFRKRSITTFEILTTRLELPDTRLNSAQAKTTRELLEIDSENCKNFQVQVLLKMRIQILLTVYLFVLQLLQKDGVKSENALQLSNIVNSICCLCSAKRFAEFEVVSKAKSLELKNAKLSNQISEEKSSEEKSSEKQGFQYVRKSSEEKSLEHRKQIVGLHNQTSDERNHFRRKEQVLKSEKKRF
ncbi:hypothetical protein OSB04_006634 [Centaurea solstitialis]|uniref:Uncharacterized protein n=1 Tax=Centaurea solstitialis TaxID=347529 RepID=A0AA38TK31_9ASTR|nr:hypothetical protein OSB04_006634 [Centaurea solstitialis]